MHIFQCILSSISNESISIFYALVESLFLPFKYGDFMTVSAYIFFKVELGKTNNVVNELRKIPEITRVAVVTGEYDIIARIKTKSLEEKYKISTEKIHMIDGIIDTLTAVIEKEEVNE